MLERNAGKLARCVPRGLPPGNWGWLLDFKQWLKDNGINSQSKYYAAFKASLLPPHSPYDPTQAYLECRSWAELFDKKPRKYKKS